MPTIEQFVYDSDQNVGLSGRTTQEDVVRVAKVQTASGETLLVGVMADGDSPHGQGERAAKLTVSRIRKVLKGANEADVVALLKLAVQDAHMALRQEVTVSGQTDYMWASVTVVAIREDELFVAHTGSTRAYRVRGNRVEQLTKDYVDERGRVHSAVGMAGQLQVDVFPAGKINPGDHIILCSDGATEPYLSAPDEMPGVLNNPNTPALEAARTLVSLAVGRKANDNVSVAVISLPRRNNRLLLIGVAALFVIICLALVGLFASGTFDPEPTATPTLPPTVTPTPAPPTATPLPPQGELTIGATSGTVQNIAGDPVSRGTALFLGDGLRTSNGGQVQILLSGGSFVYLADNSEVQFDRLDDIDAGSGRTVLTLLSGQLLVQQDTIGNVVRIQNEAGGLLARLELSGVMAVALSNNGGAVVSCFSGTCVTPAGTPIPPNTQATITTTASTNPIPFTTEDPLYPLWSAICGCLMPPEQ